MRYHKNVPGYYVENFGCRATQADGAALERQFEELGLSRASNSSQAAIVVLNTCTVTAAADQDARAAIRRIQRRNPEASIVVTGCYAQRAPKEIARLPGVTHVIGNSHKHQLAEIALTRARKNNHVGTAAHGCPVERSSTVQSAGTFISLDSVTRPPEFPETNSQRPTTSDERPIFVSDIFAHTELLAAPVFDAANERTRPNLKIQDGCDNRCSFCVIPYVRGQSRSLSPDRIIREVNALVDAGYREVVLSGINLGRWGRDLRPQPSDLSPPTPGLSKSRQRPTTNDQRRITNGQRPGFESLIRAILAETSIEKLRISSVEPMDWTDDLIALVASSARIAKHAHVPMQSASDAVLRRMHRKYRPWHYREKIEKIRAAMPAAAIGADVMVGFPGETDAEFEATRRMVEDLPFTYLHVFTYSARPGTQAASLPNQVPLHTARERNRVLRELAADKKLAFMRSFVGKTVEAITLKSECGAGAPARESRPAELTEALTDNYLKLHLKGRHEPNRWLRARVEEVNAGALGGRSLTDH
ncbi:MAG: MiaB/RimO family radical SAM methylthiotransferase [Candidatus Sulfotelmatobacter sp.]